MPQNAKQAWNEVGERFGISRQAVHCSESYALKKLRKVLGEEP